MHSPHLKKACYPKCDLTALTLFLLGCPWKLFFDKILFSKIEANIPIVCTNNMLECRDDQNSKGNMSLKSAKCLYCWSLCLKYFVLSTGLHQVIYARIWFISGLLWCWSEVVSSGSCLWNLSSIVPVYYCYCEASCAWLLIYSKRMCCTV